MRGDPKILDALNAILTGELTAINQYFIHYKMLENWGYPRLAQKKREESMCMCERPEHSISPDA